ncbi:unnamed protein product [Brachionus calyciflorus]|uniref:BTB domain-containing protein n=1 Tax=Brachionus calyciflorus TaxID=104777 RepID=A0A813WF14_9BILA|nr:unnamed protein product [Brachionus calyciflorus]
MTNVLKCYPDFKTLLLTKLNEQRFLKPPLTDLTLIADQNTYNVHKCLLIATSDYFDAMLRSGMQETRTDHIELKGISTEGLEQVINFIYTGELCLNESNIEHVLRAISHLQIKNALNLCEEYLFERINESNCIHTLNLVDLFSLKDIREKIDEFILKNFSFLILNEEFKKFNFNQLCHYISDNRLKLYPEIKVFEICIEWIKESKNELNPSVVYNILKHVRFNTMKPEDFISKVSKHEIFKLNEEIYNLIIEAYEYFSLPSRQYICTSSRSKLRNQPVMVCVNESMYILNKKEESWQYLCQSNPTTKILSQKFAVVNNFLYACGGYSEKDRETCNKCYRFDPRNAQWQSIASMNEKRQFFTLATWNDCIIAVGGVYGSVGNFYATFPSNSAYEYYSIEKDEWISANFSNSILPILKWPGACVFSENGKKIFIVGGKLTEKNCLSQESFLVDLESNSVEKCNAPITNRFNPSVFYLNKKIILFAGEDEKFRLAPCIELFDLETKQWSEIATIPISLSYQCISCTRVIGTKIDYLIEEHDGPLSESYVLSSSSFDIENMNFNKSIQLPIPSTLASKWCFLTFPLEFLENYHLIINQELKK